jgi:organic radical activating enzyme
MSFLMGLLSHNRVIVLGGNDNSEGHPLRKVYEEAGAVDLSHNSSWSLTMDPKGHYVLFNPRSGTKLRLTESGEDAPAKGTWPELIDIKITDYCHYGCSYCYQGSTPEGRHADTEHLIALAERCAESGVLEVAIGGGEPTSHPDFERIIEAFRSAGVIVNVTSRNIAYWSEIPKVPVTAVAFSVDSAQQIETILKRFHGKYPPFQIHFQVVAGVVDGAEFERMMVAAQDHRLTLLGYKDTGRGREARASLPIHNHPSQTDWIAPWMARVQAYREAQGARDAWEVKREEFFYRTLKASGESRERKVEQWHNENPYPQPEHKPSIAIDTTLASVCKQELKKSGVPPISYHTSEGAFSMYIDAVSLQAGPSSYAPENMVPYSIDNIWQVFASIPSM